MKLSKLVIQLFIPILGLTGQFVNAENAESATHPQKTLIILKRENANNHKRRPNAPNRQYIDCTYNEGHLHINFTIPEGECTCYITDIINNHTYSYYFDSSELFIDIEINDIIDFNVEITTGNGNVYNGSTIFYE